MATSSWLFVIFHKCTKLWSTNLCTLLCAGVHSGLTSEQQVVAYVWNGDSISNVELQQLLGLNSIEVGRLLHQMVEKELLDRSSKNRWTTYAVRKEKSREKGVVKRGGGRKDGFWIIKE